MRFSWGVRLERERPASGSMTARLCSDAFTESSQNRQPSPEPGFCCWLAPHLGRGRLRVGEPMTYNVMISMDDCVVLCADRSTFSVYTDDRSELSEQRVRKITETPHGFITASGWADLIQPVKERFAGEEPADVGAMLSIIQEEQDLFHKRSPELARSWIPRSCWKMSIPMSRGVTAAFYDHEKQGLSALVSGGTIFSFPPGTPSDARDHVESLFPQGHYVAPSREIVCDAIRQVLASVTYLRGRCIPISQEIDVAIHWGGSRRLLELTALD